MRDRDRYQPPEPFNFLNLLIDIPTTQELSGKGTKKADKLAQYESRGMTRREGRMYEQSLEAGSWKLRKDLEARGMLRMKISKNRNYAVEGV